MEQDPQDDDYIKAQKEWEKNLTPEQRRERRKAKLIVLGVMGGALAAVFAVGALVGNDDAPAPSTEAPAEFSGERPAQIDRLDDKPTILPFTPGLAPK